jgi:gamma-glutamylcyclotransferase (GGCT)/AIG2-like uncharacterized protein YtfP
MEQRLDLPYAVYGTLRPGCGNDGLWFGLAKLGVAGYVNDHRMVTGPSASFPYAIPALFSAIVVELVHPVERFAGLLRDRLDTLEGYPHFYDRKVVEVETYAGPVDAWFYFPCSTTFLGDTVNVFCGDWVQFINEERSRRTNRV